MKKQWFLALAADVVVVIVFAAIGRRSHGEATALAGLATTAWPFLTGLAIGWAATWALYRDKFDAYLVLPTGVLVWVSTLAIGMLARVISGQGTAFSFILVAGTFLALFLIGWRAVVRLAGSRSTSVR